MKKWLISTFFALAALPGMAQVDYEQEETFLIGKLEINPSLSFLAPSTPPQKFKIREVDFSVKETKREVNMVALMEREKNIRKRTVELSSPFPSSPEKDKGALRISDDVHFYNRGSNYDFYTGKTKNAAYREMRAGLFRGVYAPNVGGRYTSPYSYSPFLR